MSEKKKTVWAVITSALLLLVINTWVQDYVTRTFPQIDPFSKTAIVVVIVAVIMYYLRKWLRTEE